MFVRIWKKCFEKKKRKEWRGENPPENVERNMRDKASEENMERLGSYLFFYGELDQNRKKNEKIKNGRKTRNNGERRKRKKNRPRTEQRRKNWEREEKRKKRREKRAEEKWTRKKWLSSNMSGQWAQTLVKRAKKNRKNKKEKNKTRLREEATNGRK